MNYLKPIDFLLDNRNSYMTGHSLVVDGEEPFAIEMEFKMVK